ENGYVKSVLERWKDLTMQRKPYIYQRKGNEIIESVDATQAFMEQSWASQYIGYVADALQYGYSLINLGNIVDDSFPDIGFTQRQNIRIDEKGKPILTSIVYSIDGIRVKDHPLIDMCNHWIPTPTNNGASPCGYGALYNIALY